MRPGFSALVASVACIMLFTSCAGSQWKRERVTHNDAFQLFTEHYISSDEVVDQGYGHPYSFHVRELTEIFKGLTYHEARIFSDPEEQNVFYPDEAYRLAGAIAEVLGSSGSKERIRFASYNMGGGTLFSHKRKSEGVIFLKPQTVLNIAFTVINDEGDSGSDEYLKVSYDDPLRIIYSQKPLQPKEWYALKQTDDAARTHPLWAVVDLNKVRSLFEDRLAVETIKPKEPEPVKETEAVLEVKEEDDLKEKLKRLKEYYDEGLIDEEEYKVKKKELLEKVTG